MDEEQLEVIGLIFQDYNVQFKNIKKMSYEDNVYFYEIKDEIDQEMKLEVNFREAYYRITTKDFEEIIELVTL